MSRTFEERKLREVSTRGVSYELNKDEAFKEFRSAVRNGQQRLALEYAVLLFDQLLAGREANPDAEVFADEPEPVAEPEPAPKAPRKQRPTTSEVVEDGDGE